MEATFLSRLRGNLSEKRLNLSGWLGTAPPDKKARALGPAPETNLHAHMQVLDGAIQKADARTLGVCTVCNQSIETEYLEMDYTAMVCLEHLSAAQARQLESDLELSRTIQQSLLPASTPVIPGLDLAVFSRPAEILGGDYYDFLKFGDGSHALAIADVAGHGVQAGLLMASALSILRAFIPQSQSPAEALKHMNTFFSHNVRFTTFVTLFLARYDPVTRVLDYCNAGHNPPLLHHNASNGSERLTWLQPTAAAVGLIEDYQVGARRVELARGDLLLMYTDGVTEAANPAGEFYGAKRLAEVVRQYPHMPAAEMVHMIWHRLEEFSGSRSPDDDTTLIACRVSRS